MTTLESISFRLKAGEGTTPDLEGAGRAAADLGAAQVAVDKAAMQVTDAVITTLRSRNPPPERLAQLDRATHCLHATRCVFGPFCLS